MLGPTLGHELSLEQKLDMLFERLDSIDDRLVALEKSSGAATAERHQLREDIADVKQELDEFRPGFRFIRDIQGGARFGKAIAIGLGAILGTITAIISIVQYFQGR